MRQTLFFIPHEILGVPVFGFGWALMIWAVVSLITIIGLVRRQGWNEETRSFLFFLVAVAAVIIWGLPLVEAAQSGPANQGLPIRGYGMMLLLAVASGVGLAAWRARRMGIDPEIIYSLAFWMFVFGIAGARLFYIIEYWETFLRPTVRETLFAMLNVTQGGLVVYGSMIGALAAGAIYLLRRNLPILATADLIAPSMVLGLAFGRIGCFLNGCCFGGVCDLPWAVQFPPHSPPYFRQHQLGQLHGFRIVEGQHSQPLVGYVDPESPAARAGLREGQRILSVQLPPEAAFQAAATTPAFGGQTIVVKLVSGEERRLRPPPYNISSTTERLGLRVLDVPNGPAVVAEVTVGGPADQAGVRTGDWIVDVRLPETPSAAVAQDVMQWADAEVTIETEEGVIAWTMAELPSRTLPVHPTQVYASITAFLIFFFLWVYYPFRTRDGEVFTLLITIYPITRFLEEIIRVDEPAQFGTGLSISQLISVGLLIAAGALWVYLARQHSGSVWPPVSADRAEALRPSAG